jgi:hypothetical protein
MRKLVGLLSMTALLLPAGVIAAQPASAAGNSCTKAAGSATFKPPLPKIGNPKKVSAKLASVGTVSGCTGGGVKSGKTSFTQTSKPRPANCTTLVTVKKSDPPTVGTLTIKWNNGKTSTAKGFKIKQTAATEATTTGKVTAGLFVGKTISGTITFTPQKDGCTKKDLAKVTYVNKKGTKFVLK